MADGPTWRPKPTGRHWLPCPALELGTFLRPPIGCWFLHFQSRFMKRLTCNCSIWWEVPEVGNSSYSLFILFVYNCCRSMAKSLMWKSYLTNEDPRFVCFTFKHCSGVVGFFWGGRGHFAYCLSSSGKYLDGWLSTVRSQPTRSTQPSTLCGMVKWVLAVVKAIAREETASFAQQ